MRKTFHVFGKHNPWFLLRLEEGREGLTLHDSDVPCYSLLHPIDRVHNSAINKTCHPLSPNLMSSTIQGLSAASH